MGPLRDRNFRLFFAGQSISYLGNAVVPVAITFAVLDLTHSALDLSYVLGAQSAAQVVCLLAGGVISDRIPRRVVMIGADVARGAAQAVLGALLITGHARVPSIAVLTVIQGIASAMYYPASAGILPTIVSPRYLHQANHLQQVAGAVASIAGPAIAGVVVVLASPGWAILLDAASFGVSIVLLAAMRIEALPPPAQRKFIRDFREGWNEFRSRRWLWSMVIAFSIVNFLTAAYTVLGPVASQRYYGGAAAWAAVATIGGVGSVAGGVLALRLRSRHPLRLAVAVVIFAGFTPIAFGIGLPVPAIAAVAAVAGTGDIIFISIYNSTIQRQVPSHFLSRVDSYAWFGALVVFPIGLAAGGPMASVLGVRTALLGVGALMVLVTALLLAVPDIRKLTDDAPALACAPSAEPSALGHKSR
jgi:MFS family permease